MPRKQVACQFCQIARVARKMYCSKTSAKLHSVRKNTEAFSVPIRYLEASSPRQTRSTLRANSPPRTGPPRGMEALAIPA